MAAGGSPLCSRRGRTVGGDVGCSGEQSWLLIVESCQCSCRFSVSSRAARTVRLRAPRLCQRPRHHQPPRRRLRRFVQICTATPSTRSTGKASQRPKRGMEPAHQATVTLPSTRCCGPEGRQSYVLAASTTLTLDAYASASRAAAHTSTDHPCPAAPEASATTTVAGEPAILDEIHCPDATGVFALSAYFVHSGRAYTVFTFDQPETKQRCGRGSTHSCSTSHSSESDRAVGVFQDRTYGPQPLR